ncbi:MAG TPA: FAD-dependent oxidoreductase, partial [Planctomycetota bacterium]|nr:FAD-dependent oxidoreductase [Planctomycetota bacterium]
LAAAAACRKTPPAGNPGAPGAGRRVLVVGGGLCGLRTLDLLLERGFDARLLEGATRLGGRLYTLREGLPAGLRVELGGERVAHADARVHALMERLGLTPAPYPAPSGAIRATFGGRTFDGAAPPPDLFEGLGENERDGAPFFVHASVAEAARPPADDDPRSGLEWLRAAGLTPRGEALVRAFTYHEIDRLPAPALARAIARELAVRGGAASVGGGADQLAERLAVGREGRIERGFVAAEVEVAGDVVRLRDARGEAREAAAAVFCLSLSALRKLKFAAGTPAPLAARLDGLAVGDELKVSAHLPASARAVAEYSAADAFPRASWRLPETAADGPYVWNVMAVRDDVAPAREAWKTGAAGFAAYMARRAPDVAPHGPRWFAHDWKLDPLAGGAYAWARTPAGLEPGPLRAGPLWFAGGDLSSLPGWMEGALESAESVAAAVEAGG